MVDTSAVSSLLNPNTASDASAPGGPHTDRWSGRSRTPAPPVGGADAPRIRSSPSILIAILAAPAAFEAYLAVIDLETDRKGPQERPTLSGAFAKVFLLLLWASYRTKPKCHFRVNAQSTLYLHIRTLPGVLGEYRRGRAFTHTTSRPQQSPDQFLARLPCGF